VEQCYIDQYYGSHIISYPECRAEYDISCLKTWIIGNACSADTFKQKMLTEWPSSTVSIDHAAEPEMGKGL